MDNLIELLQCNFPMVINFKLNIANPKDKRIILARDPTISSILGINCCMKWYYSEICFLYELNFQLI